MNVKWPFLTIFCVFFVAFNSLGAALRGVQYDPTTSTVVPSGLNITAKTFQITNFFGLGFTNAGSNAVQVIDLMGPQVVDSHINGNTTIVLTNMPSWTNTASSPTLTISARHTSGTLSIASLHPISYEEFNIASGKTNQIWIKYLNGRVSLTTSHINATNQTLNLPELESSATNDFLEVIDTSTATRKKIAIANLVTGGGGGTNFPAVLLLSGNTNLTGQAGNITAYFQITNGSHGLDFDLAAPSSGHIFRNFETNSATTNYTVTFYTNGIAGSYYNPETKTNETTFIVPAGSLTMQEWTLVSGNWVLTRHIQPVGRANWGTGLSASTNGINGLDITVSATATGSGGGNSTNVSLFTSASTNLIVDAGLASTNHVNFNIGMLTNSHIVISNWSLAKFPVAIRWKQDTNGNRVVLSLANTDGLIITNGFNTLGTNASGLTEWVLRPDFYPTNVIITSGGSGELLTTTTNLLALGTRYTNSFKRTMVSASFTLTAAVAGTAAVAMYVERFGVTNRLAISAGPLTSLVTIEPLMQLVGPGEIYYFTDETSGSGATAAIIANTSTRIDL